jgi:cytosine deaminase
MAFFDKLSVPDAGRYWLRRARVLPGFLTAPLPADATDGDGAALTDILVSDGGIAAIELSGTSAPSETPSLDMAGRHLWPTMVDMHTHIDKGQIVGRIPASDISFARARQAVVADRAQHWNHDDIYRRMEFAVRCAYVHGTSAIRTHIDSYEGMAEASWQVFTELRDAWRNRVALQGVASVPIDVWGTDYGRRLADLTAASGGVLGGVTRSSQQHHAQLLPNIDALLDDLLRLAIERGLDIDLHVDESSDPAAASLERVAQAVLRHKFRGRVVCGHCCSLSVQSDEMVQRTLAVCAEAGIAVASMAPVNLYFHDRAAGRTPRWRGITLIHELQAAGIPVAVASDNIRDPFHPFGDYDMLEVLKTSLYIGHLDQRLPHAPLFAGRTPADIIGVAPIGRLEAGAAARLILLNARSLSELLSRPQSDRIIIDRGRQVTDPLPDFAELDADPLLPG